MYSRRLHCWLVLASMAAAGVAQSAPLAWAVSSDSGDRLYQIDLADGSTVNVGAIAAPYSDVEGLALSASGVLYAIDDNTKTLITLDSTSAAVNIPGGARSNTGLPTGISNPLDPSITFACDGRLLLSSTRGKLYEVNLSSGSATPIGGTGTTMAENITDIAARGPHVYGLGYTGLYRINVADGSSTLIGSYGNGVSFSEGGGMAFDLSGNLWAIADRSVGDAPSLIFRIDTGTGRATAAGSTSIRGIESLTVRPTDCSPAAMGVPSIPVTAVARQNLNWTVLLLAALGLWQLRRR
jgi:hypothetical protein